MKKTKIIGTFVFISIVIVGLVIGYKNLKESKNTDNKAIMIGDMIASYEYVDRNINIEYFYDLDVNTTYKEIENEIGKPNGAIGSGITIPYYQVGDQYVVVWFAGDEDGMHTNILRMGLYTRDAYVGDIPLKE